VVVERLPRPDVIFFDLFGTIFQWTKPPRAAISDALATEGFEVAPEAVNKARVEVERKLPTKDEWPTESEVQYWRHFDRELLTKLGLKSNPKVLAAIRREFEANVRLELQADAVPTLKALREQGAALGVISNATFGMRRDLARLGVEPYFQHVVFSQPLNARKPDPHIFLIALSKYGCPPTRAWMVGDEPESDVRGARGVGMVPILIDRASKHPEATSTRIGDLREVADLYRTSEA
jgi:HAD superfamily hydrolase (TIGR01549 family)